MSVCGRRAHDHDGYRDHDARIWHRPAGRWLTWRDHFGVLHREFRPWHREWHHDWRRAEHHWRHRDDDDAWRRGRGGVTIIYRGWF